MSSLEPPSSPRADCAATGEIDGVVGMAIRVSEGICGEPERLWLCEGFAIWYRAGGEVPLDRCLRLPSTFKKLRAIERRHYLLMAAAEIEADGIWCKCVLLAEELQQFIARGAWKRWKDLAAPPGGTSQLRTALFHIARLNAGRALTARRVFEILRERLKEGQCDEVRC